MQARLFYDKKFILNRSETEGHDGDGDRPDDDSHVVQIDNHDRNHSTKGDRDNDPYFSQGSR